MRYKPHKIIVSLILGVFLIYLVNASVVCDSASVSLNDNQNSYSIRCLNQGNSTIYLSSTSQYLSIYPNSINPGSNPLITFSMLSSIPTGTYNEQVTMSDGSFNVSVSMTKTVQQTSPSSCSIDIFPLSLSNVKIKQGETKQRNIQLTIPSCYPSTVKVQGVVLQTDEKPIQLGELNMGLLQPGNSVMIPLDMDASDVATGTYTDSLSFLLYNSSGARIDVSPVSISVLVSQGISPISNLSFSDLPSCSLSAVQFGLNSTGKLTCTNSNPNINIQPVYDRTMIQGTSVNVAGNQYIYEFKPIKIGTTTISANFLYMLFPVGSGFQQEIRITPSGNEAISGTQMKFEFIPSLSNAKDNDNLVVHAVDNKTNSYVNDAKIYLDGSEINGSFNIKAQRNYSLRAVANGYLDYIEYIYINPRNIEITLSPSSGFSEGNSISVTTNPENASLFLDGAKIDKVFTPSKGEHTIEAIYEGYQNTKLNISVSEIVSISSNTVWTKGIEQRFLLSKNSSWQVSYAKDSSKPYVQQISGNSNLITFTPKDSGLYQISIDGIVRDTKEIKSFDWNAKWGFMAWWLWILIVVGVLIFLVIIFRGRGSTKIDSDLSSAGFQVDEK